MPDIGFSCITVRFPNDYPFGFTITSLKLNLIYSIPFGRLEKLLRFYYFKESLEIS